MGIRRFVTLLCAASLALTASIAQPAHAASPTDYVFKPFTAAGTIYNNAPPIGNPTLDLRVYLDGDNFTILPVTSASNSVRPLIDYRNALGVNVLPLLTSYTINGDTTDFAGALVEGCTTEVTGIVLQLPAAVSRDLPYALSVDTTCP